jgi:hypothetical protein
LLEDGAGRLDDEMVNEESEIRMAGEPGLIVDYIERPSVNARSTVWTIHSMYEVVNQRTSRVQNYGGTKVGKVGMI